MSEEMNDPRNGAPGTALETATGHYQSGSRGDKVSEDNMTGKHARGKYEEETGPRAIGTQEPESHRDSTEKANDSIGEDRAVTNRKGENLDAALWYARGGVEVFPVGRDSKKPLLSMKQSLDRGGNGRRWQKTTDEDRLRRYWAEHPDANIGIATGPASGFWVVDLDVKHDGIDNWQKLVGDKPMPETVTVQTPSGGLHYWFRWPEGVDVRNSNSSLGEGIDVRGEGGYVGAPPSERPGKGCYAFAPGLSPDEVEIADAPDWLYAAIAEAKENDKAKAKQIVPRTRMVDGPIYRKALAKRAERWLEVELAVIKAAEEGTRNMRLSERGVVVGGLSTYLPEGYAWERLMDAVADWEDEEPGKTLNSATTAFNKGAAAPTTIDINLDDLPLSDEDLSDVIAKGEFGENHINVIEWGWLRWTGHTWKEVKDEFIYQTIQSHLGSATEEVERVTAAQAIRAAALMNSNPSVKKPGAVREAGASIRNSLGREARDRAIFSKLSSKLAASASAFDTDPVVLGTPGGVVDLRTGEMRPGRKEDMISKSTLVVPAAKSVRSELWLKFLDDITGGDQEMIEFLQRLAGYALTGLTREEQFYFFYGKGRNGKGTFLQTLFWLLATYAAKADAEAFMSNSKKMPERAMAPLDGARLVWGSEIEKGRKWNESLLKDMTGGDSLNARRLWKEEYSYDSVATLIIAGNTRPGLRGVDQAMRSRLVLVPFDNKFLGKAKDATLKEKFCGKQGKGPEAPAILRWFIEGAEKYLKDGLKIPKKVELQTAEYLDGEDDILQFVTDCCVEDVDAWVSSAELYKAHQEWSKELGLMPISQRALSGKMRDAGYDIVQRALGSARRKGIAGLRLKQGDETEM